MGELFRVEYLTVDGKAGEKRRFECVKEPYENSQAWKLFTKNNLLMENSVGTDNYISRRFGLLNANCSIRH